MNSNRSILYSHNLPNTASWRPHKFPGNVSQCLEGFLLEGAALQKARPACGITGSAGPGSSDPPKPTAASCSGATQPRVPRPVPTHNSFWSAWTLLSCFFFNLHPIFFRAALLLAETVANPVSWLTCSPCHGGVIQKLGHCPLHPIAKWNHGLVIGMGNILAEFLLIPWLAAIHKLCQEVPILIQTISPALAPLLAFLPHPPGWVRECESRIMIKQLITIWLKLCFPWAQLFTKTLIYLPPSLLQLTCCWC